MNNAFFSRLYQGYAAEHYVSGLLFSQSYEVFRLPADFGLDLVVTDRFRVAQGGSPNSTSFPFALQVKSRWLRPTDISNGPNGRLEATFSYKLKSDEIDVLNTQANSALVFVFYWPVKVPTVFRPHMFVIHSGSIAELVDKKFFRKKGADFEFTVRYRALPFYTRESFISELTDQVSLSTEIKSVLQKMLPGRIARSWKADAYFQFARSSKNETSQLVFRSVWNVASDFSAFPSFPKIGGLD